MERFRYTARDQNGALVTGEITASSAATATTRLEQDGLRVERLDRIDEGARADADAADHEGSGPSPASKSEAVWLSDENFIEVGERVTEIARAGLPLSPGLRALCEELPHSALRRSLLQLSERLEAGESLETAVETTGDSLPRGLRAIIRAGLRSNKLGLLLEQYLAHARRALDERRYARMALVYPTILFTIASLVLGFYLIGLVPQFKSIYSDFGTELPGATVALISLSDFLVNYAPAVIIVLVIVLAIAYFVTGRIWGAGRRRRILLSIPLIGPMFAEAALTHYCGLLALLVESRVPLPESIEIAGEASRDPALAEDSRWMADGLRQGMRLDEAALLFSRLPVELRHAFRWEGRLDAMVAGLSSAGEIFAARSSIRGGLMRVLISPLIVIGAGLMILTLMGLLFLPLIKLLNDLS